MKPINTPRRNPYVILGLLYGATKDEARRRAARILRKLKSTTDSPYTVEDVTWALHQIEIVNENPEVGLDIFRVPATDALRARESCGGIFSNPRASPPSNQQDLQRIVGAALVELGGIVLEKLALSVDSWPTYSDWWDQA
jgi:hypothetical protein